MSAISIFIVDDDQIAIFINKRILSSSGHTWEISEDEDAEQALVRLKEIKSPDVLLLDINMPEMNGWSFLEQYTERGFDKNSTLIYMLSSSSNERDIDKAKTFDCVHGYLEKPLSQASVDRIVQDLKNANKKPEL